MFYLVVFCIGFFLKVSLQTVMPGDVVQIGNIVDGYYNTNHAFFEYACNFNARTEREGLYCNSLFIIWLILVPPTSPVGELLLVTVFLKSQERAIV